MTDFYSEVSDSENKDAIDMPLQINKDLDLTEVDSALATGNATDATLADRLATAVVDALNETEI